MSILNCSKQKQSCHGWDALRMNMAPSHPLYFSGWKWDFWFKHHFFSFKMAQANNVLNISLCVVILSWQVWVNDTMTWTELISNRVYNRSAKVVFLHCKKDLFTCRQYFHSDISPSLLWSVIKLTCKRHKWSNEGHESAKTSYLSYILSKFKTD